MLERWPVASYSGSVQVRPASVPKSASRHLNHRLSMYFKFNLFHCSTSKERPKKERPKKERMSRFSPSPSPKAKVNQPEVMMYQPKIKLRPRRWWHWLPYIPQFILWIVIIAANAYISFWTFDHRLLPRNEITGTPQFVVLFACMMIPFVILFHQGYTADIIRPLDGHGREEWARTLDANFRKRGEPYRSTS